MNGRPFRGSLGPMRGGIAAALFLWGASWIGAPARAAASPELVYTAPQECGLEQPTLRPPTVVWPELFDSATRRIDIEQQYLTDGESLRPSLASLRRAGERGVQIRVLVEGKLLAQSQPLLDELRGYPNTEVRVLPFAKLHGGVVHNKMLLIDGRRAYVGSQNFDWRALSHIHELGLRLDDEALVAQLQALFEWDWAAQALVARGADVPPLNRTRPGAQSDRPVYVVGSPYEFLPPGIGDSETELVRLIGSAKRRLQIQVLIYAPLDYPERTYYGPIDSALRAALVRGVKVELLVSNWNAGAPKIDWLKSLSVLPGIEIKMVSLPQSRAGFIPYARVIHSKYMVIDDETLWLGTSNWAGGYFDNSRNVEIVIRDGKLAAQAAAVHGQLWRSPYGELIDPKKIYTPPRVH